MKAVILAGGLGSRLSEETSMRPKPLVDTGESTMTGGRLKRALPYVADGDFCFTYGDGVADVDITASIDFHREQGREATVTAVKPPGRFGSM